MQPVPIKFEALDPHVANELDDEDLEVNALIYLHQLTELQKAEWKSWGRQIKTFGIFNEGSTYWRNTRGGETHFTRLLNKIESIALHPLLSKNSIQKYIQDMCDVYEEAFDPGCLLHNAMGAEIGKTSSYHVMLRRWIRTLDIRFDSDYMGRQERHIWFNEKTLEAQFKNYREFMLTPHTDLEDNPSSINWKKNR